MMQESMNKRVCVVGGGFGGLTMAAYLAHAGYRVTLLEKNNELGGRARSWRSHGFVFDMGPSWYLMPEVFERFFSDVGCRREDYYDLQQLDPSYRVFFQNSEPVTVTPRIAESEALFESFERGGGAKLREYLKAAEYKYDVAVGEFLYREYRSLFQFFNWRLMTEGLKLNVFSSLDRFVGRYFRDERARQILQYAMVFLGTSPEQAPALYSIMSHIDLNQGVWFPKGGMAAMVAGLERLLRENGVEIHLGEPVQEIVVENGGIKGVRTAEGEVGADAVVVNADYAHAELELLAPEHRTYSERYWRARTLAPTMLIVYLGYNRKLKNIAHHNLYFSQPWKPHFDAIFKHPQWPDHPSYYVSCASYDDPGVAAAGTENVFFLVPVSPRLEDTDEVRERLVQYVMDHFSAVSGNDMNSDILLKRIYSHRDFRSDYNAYSGTSLGLAHTLFQTAVFRPQMRSRKVRGLFYSGQYTHPGVGVPMTFIASRIARDIVRQEVV